MAPARGCHALPPWRPEDQRPWRCQGPPARAERTAHARVRRALRRALASDGDDLQGISLTIELLGCVDAGTGAFVMGAWYPGGEGGCGERGGVWRFERGRVAPYFEAARSSEIRFTYQVDLTGDEVPEVVVLRTSPQGDAHVEVLTAARPQPLLSMQPDVRVCGPAEPRFFDIVTTPSGPTLCIESRLFRWTGGAFEAAPVS